MIISLLLLQLFISCFSIPDSSNYQIVKKMRSLQQSLTGGLKHAQWTHIDGKLSNIHLTNQKGNCTMFFSSKSLNTKRSNNLNKHTVNSLTISLYDPIYINKGMIRLEIQLKGFFNQQQNIWSGSTTSNVTIFEQGSQVNQLDFPVQFIISGKETNIIINGVSLKIKTSPKLYSWVPCFILISQLLSILVMQFTSIIKKSTISVITVIFILVNHLSLSFVYIYISFDIAPQYSIFFMFSAAFTIVCFLKALQKYQHLLFIRNKWEKLIIIILVVYIYCHLFFFKNEIFNILNSTVLFPQIIKNIKRNTKNISNNFHLIMLFTLNNILPIYIHSSESNIFRIYPNKTTSFFLITSIISQIIFLITQYFLKSLCSFLFKPKTKNEQIICSICLFQAKDDEIVTTLCEHQFHEKCLLKWLQHKSVCPMDRKIINIDDLY